MQGIVVFNDLVLGGVLFGMFGGLIKHIIERSKIAEIRNRVWGRSVKAIQSIFLSRLLSFTVLFISIFLYFDDLN